MAGIGKAIKGFGKALKKAKREIKKTPPVRKEIKAVGKGALIGGVIVSGMEYKKRKARGDYKKSKTDVPEEITALVTGMRKVSKNQKKFNLSGWLDDTVEQAERLDEAVPVLVVKRPGRGAKSLDDTYAVMRLCDLVCLLQDAGYT